MVCDLRAISPPHLPPGWLENLSLMHQRTPPRKWLTKVGQQCAYFIAYLNIPRAHKRGELLPSIIRVILVYHKNQKMRLLRARIVCKEWRWSLIQFTPVSVTFSGSYAGKRVYRLIHYGPKLSIPKPPSPVFNSDQTSVYQQWMNGRLPRISGKIYAWYDSMVNTMQASLILLYR